MINNENPIMVNLALAESGPYEVVSTYILLTVAGYLGNYSADTLRKG